MPVYDVDAASERSHYAPESIKHYCYDGTLERGRDFLVMEYRKGCYKRAVLVITDAGIARLIHRHSHRIRRAYEDARVATRSDTT